MSRFPAGRMPPTGPQPSDKAMRSVFVGNIGYDVTEEELTDVFNQVGPVLSFRLVYDRDTGKSKGFGFCEYHNVEHANAAIRNMNHFELKGRNLRLDSAVTNERMMMGEDVRPAGKPQMPQPAASSWTSQSENPYGPTPLDGKTPEAISRSLAQMSPEMMFKVIKDMKEIAMTDATRCRDILDREPQLAFALLQAQVMMHWLDTDTAFNLLDRSMNSEKMAERVEMSNRSIPDERTMERPGPPVGFRQEMMPPPHAIEKPAQFFGHPLPNQGPPPFHGQFPGPPGHGVPGGFPAGPPGARPWGPGPGGPPSRFGAAGPPLGVPPFNHGGFEGIAAPHFPPTGAMEDGFNDGFRNFVRPSAGPNFPPQGPPRPIFPPAHANPNFRPPLPSQQQAYKKQLRHGEHPDHDNSDDMELLNDLLLLTDEQIAQLPPQEAAKVRELQKMQRR